MGLHMTNRPDAAPGIPKDRVAPADGTETRIGTRDPGAVAQLQAVQWLAEFPVRTLARDFPAQALRCRMYTCGSATGSAQRRSNPGAGNAVPSRWSGSSKAASFMSRRAFPKRSIPRRTAAMVTGSWPGHGGCVCLAQPCSSAAVSRWWSAWSLGAVERWPTPSSQFAPSIFRREPLGGRISDDHRGVSGDLRAAGSRIIDDLGSPRGMGRPNAAVGGGSAFSVVRPGRLSATARRERFRAVPGEAFSGPSQGWLVTC